DGEDLNRYGDDGELTADVRRHLTGEEEAVVARLTQRREIGQHPRPGHAADGTESMHRCRPRSTSRERGTSTWRPTGSGTRSRAPTSTAAGGRGSVSSTPTASARARRGRRSSNRLSPTSC